MAHEKKKFIFEQLIAVILVVSINAVLFLVDTAWRVFVHNT